LDVFGVRELKTAIRKAPYRNRRSEIQDGGHQTGSTCISASVQDSKEIPEANPMFSGLEYSMAILRKLNLKSGSENLKMAAAKPEVPVTQLLCKIAKKFQRLFAYFWGRESQWHYWLCSFLESEVRNSRWRLLKPDVPVTQLLCKIAKKFQRIAPCFQRRKLNGDIGYALS
jgi:hypothetical protein